MLISRKNSTFTGPRSLVMMLVVALMMVAQSTQKELGARTAGINTKQRFEPTQFMQEIMPRVGQSSGVQLDEDGNIIDPIHVNFTRVVKNFRAFEYGLDGDHFAANFSTCSIHSLAWWFYEVSTFKIKMRYANYNDALTNVTLFLQNTTGLMITCSDVIENLYYYGSQEAEKFAGGTDWGLGLLQALLGSILRITAITNDLVQMGKNNETDVPKTLYYCGEILNMLLIFDPVSADLQRLVSTDIKLPQVSVSEALALKEQVLNKPRVMNDEQATFMGQSNLQHLGSSEGVVMMIMGFFSGTGLVPDVRMLQSCEDTIRQKMVHNAWLMTNQTASKDHFGALFSFWDLVYNIHPMTMTCRSWIYGFGLEIATRFDNIDDLRRIVVNIVNHIDEMTDAVLDLVNFFNSKAVGVDEDGPYRVGQAIGSIVFYSIAKENSDPMYDPAAGMDMQQTPWEVIIVDIESRKAAEAAAALFDQ